MTSTFLQHLPPDLRTLRWREHPLDGKLLLFDRDSGLNVLLEGDETADVRRIAPRTLLIAITNVCNLTCHFCYRDQQLRSLWRYQTLLDFCREIDAWGVAEVAFGGGEPMLFPRWAEFINEVYATTTLCLNFTTNGTLLTADFLRAIHGKYGQIRVSLYDDNHWIETLALMHRCNARYGVNWLISPSELAGIEGKFIQLLALGVRDFLLLSYKGSDPALHLTQEQTRQLSAFLNKVHHKLGNAVSLKLDICWGNALPDVPRLFVSGDCGAGDDFLSITSDKYVKACSFAQTSVGFPFDTVADLRQIWETQRHQRQAAIIGGCARLPDRGLKENGANSAYISVAAIQ
ncbi:MAG: radical SAM protein [Anaerolineae bacterium]|nr:radical SAM protein [Anaerolineae bacterium]